jgi:ubiquinone/menaquinone biosynthesis C-methylase UbiE
MPNEWTNPEHACAYLARKTAIPHRDEGEPNTKRVLDLGCGDGHLLALVLDHCRRVYPPRRATGVGLDLSESMLEQAQKLFAGDPRVQFISHNMDQRLPDLGAFDCVVSSFAIHHCTHERKREIYAEVFSLLEPGGVFCNLEHVASPTPRIHERFLQEMEIAPADEDPSNKLLDVETQLRWLREIGFVEVDCHWKWRELALLVGCKE